MINKKPGIERNQCISDDGLARLQKQLESGRKLSRTVLSQWIIRYGDAAKQLIKHHHQD